MTNSNYPGLWIKFVVRSRRNIPHRHRNASLDMSLFVLPGLAHIQQNTAVSFVDAQQVSQLVQ